MSAKLEVVAGPNEGQVFTLAEDSKVTIGRGDSANFRLTDHTVSRTHCVIEYFGGQAVLKDCASKTGTKVNGDPITTHKLESLESIIIGSTKMRFQCGPPPAATLKEQMDEEAGDIEELFKLSGTTLAHYQIGQNVGVGHSGVVFRAKDSKDQREVALKIYLPEFAENDEDLQRFIRAVKTMLPMRHPNVVTLYGGGKTGPYCWMAMELVDGESLAKTIERISDTGNLDWRLALNVGLGIGRGLFYIHSEKIIHRNLTPGNILLSRQGVAKMGSLILAKALSGALAKNVTMGGELLGDIHYIAPEQAGAGGPVDGRADIYSLGSVFYALLTGKPPFQGSSQVQTATWILQREPTPPRIANPSIPKPLEKIVLKMLAKKPEDRFQSAGELMAELEQLPTS
jgi:eukaryotic-like serine/threonine-protein kinase